MHTTCCAIERPHPTRGWDACGPPVACNPTRSRSVHGPTTAHWPTISRLTPYAGHQPQARAPRRAPCSSCPAARRRRRCCPTLPPRPLRRWVCNPQRNAINMYHACGTLAGAERPRSARSGCAQARVWAVALVTPPPRPGSAPPPRRPLPASTPPVYIQPPTGPEGRRRPERRQPGRQAGV